MGGLLGGGKAPTLAKPSIDDETPKKADIDPNKSSQVAEARKRRVSLASRTGRSALRIDLANTGTQTRGGISTQ